MLERFGEMALAQGDDASALVMEREAETLYERIGDARGVARAKRNLGDIALSRSDLDGARSKYEEALAIESRIGDALGLEDTRQRLLALDRPSPTRG